MSSSSNSFNFTSSPGGDRRRGREYGFNTYVPISDDRNYPSSSIPVITRSTPSQATLDGSRGSSYDPWRPIDETLTGPLGLLGFYMRPNSIGPFLVVNNGLARQSPPPGPAEGFASSSHEESRLSQDEQIKALKKLRKEIYNPSPKRISSRMCLYYRDQALNVLNERAREKEEDGKSCVVCLEDFEPKEAVMLTPCNHMFHEECIVPWVKSHGQCPVCRFAICDRIGGGTAGPFNNITNIPASDLPARDLISFLRSVGAI
ncbi:hypothetical protein JCGZ_25855 [Jatropha curcas]|uniref:RING-type domain-containing protein n=1 Tax=Jatropha curcas TaxID=180498 RepID=A0A067JN43_JATCU|nr:E3 ubiquitin-protein ligase RING1 [Jatropha curcas]KDP24198.1 hypothetical protein JCGZ_25855 [Jatropha curcas]